MRVEVTISFEIENEATAWEHIDLMMSRLWEDFFTEAENAKLDSVSFVQPRSNKTADK